MHLSHLAPPLTGPVGVVESLSALAGVPLRIWRYDGRTLRPYAGPSPGWSPTIPLRPGFVPTPTGSIWLEPIPGAEGFWLEIGGDSGRQEEAAHRVVPVVRALLTSERETAAITDELATRYEEIDLLYGISEILGHTVRLEDAARTIAYQVSSVVGARRASIMVYDDATGVLRTVAARGFSTSGLEPVPVDDECSVAARVWREKRIIVFDPQDPLLQNPGCPDGRDYKGEAFLSIPICYAAPGASSRCVGVINLTDRLGGDAFTASDRKLLSAVANQIGAAIENARLFERDLKQQRVQRELELAHNLQLKLLPDPHVLQGDAEVAAICRPVESVGGDFYTFSRLGLGRVGVMFGDVSSHGFSAALVMALVMSAAGIHAGGASTPDETLAALLESLGTELATTEMFLSVFYGVLDPRREMLTYANAGHQHAFRVPREGAPERLLTTAPPLGLASADSITRRQVPWAVGQDLLCLWTDGLVDTRAGGAGLTEDQLLELICEHRNERCDAIVHAVFAEAESRGLSPADDRTLLVLRI